MINRYEHKKLVWLDVLSPTSDEVHELIQECGVPPKLAGDLTSPTPRTEAVSQKGALKITLDFPVVKRTDVERAHEIKFIVTKTHLVTVRFEDIEAVHSFAKSFEVMCMLRQKINKTSTTTLFFTLLDYLYTAMDEKLDYVESQLQEIEKRVFNGEEREMVFAISEVSRRLIDFRQTLGAHEKALEQLPDCVAVAFTGSYTLQIESLEHIYRHVNRRVYALISTAEDYRDTNNSLLTTKQNEVMKMFTILAFITFPLTLFTSMFGMNTVTTPIVGYEGDFWIILSIMAVVSVSFFAYFRYRKWF